jgi:glutamate--cysteine ligase
MRGADSGPWSRLCAFSGFWTGILYDQAALDAAWELVKDWTAAERESIRQSVRVLGMKTPIPGGRTMQDLAKDVLMISRNGLKSRARLGSAGDDETGFISELDEIADSGLTPADRLLELYHGEWGKRVEPAFETLAY